MYDFSNFFNVAAENGPIVLAVVVGLTTLSGKLGLKGKAQLVAALVIGLVFGGSFQIAAMGLPEDFAGWFSTVVYGLTMGLTSSGLYETAKGVMEKYLIAIGIDESEG